LTQLLQPIHGKIVASNILDYPNEASDRAVLSNNRRHFGTRLPYARELHLPSSCDEK
jgi:hypothetical protein